MVECYVGYPLMQRIMCGVFASFLVGMELILHRLSLEMFEYTICCAIFSRNDKVCKVQRPTAHVSIGALLFLRRCGYRPEYVDTKLLMSETPLRVVMQTMRYYSCLFQALDSLVSGLYRISPDCHALGLCLRPIVPNHHEDALPNPPLPPPLPPPLSPPLLYFLCDCTTGLSALLLFMPIGVLWPVSTLNDCDRKLLT